ncbi:MAG: hypothetical protein P0Y56_10285 [Candidatus Andeanibacterium colombiense]|uniref:Uncharacterized protein n=1 Tax=Candidatus Andeanibacterium colombiense TaxID=3121345 RepID=A0AAJ5X6E3_9SPHN|nr:MAG: hypothetical protein P0Y56_10285 [Sphingomonadaceae bacterium]
MSALPPNFPSPAALAAATPLDGRVPFGSAASAVSLKWTALQDAGAVVAMLAGLDPERASPEIRNFPAAIRTAGEWRRHSAENGIDDLAAIMEPGIAALLAVNARGADPHAPALALWREFHAARTALLALVAPGDKAGSRDDA